jgi:ribonuclease HI
MSYSFRGKSSSQSGSRGLFAAQAAPESYLIAHIDGGARGTPGPAGYGVVITDQAGHKVAGLSEYLGHQTNNYAEYNGLLAALDYAIEHGHKALKVVADSELLVKQIRGEYKVKSPTLLELYQRARKMIAQLEWFSIQHVLRGGNQEADRLANLAMDKGTGRKSAADSTPAGEGARRSTGRSDPHSISGNVRFRAPASLCSPVLCVLKWLGWLMSIRSACWWLSLAWTGTTAEPR